MNAAVAPHTTAPVSRTSRVVPTRRVSFEASIAELPKYFADDGDLVMSHILATLSGVFPDGEEFFVRSVRNFRDQVSEPSLKKAVSGFIGQEAVHGREHRMLNARLAELGYHTDRIERFTKKGLAFRERVFPPEVNLASTAALEHFTATLGEIILRDPEARNLLGAPELTDLLLWHALEECEHKAVAFDVYRTIGGSEKTRTRVMDFICLTFIGGMTIEVLVGLFLDRRNYDRKTLMSSLRRVRRSPWIKKEVWAKLRDYNRPDFHPDDHDTEALLAEWRDELFGDNGRLNELLVARN